MATTQPVTDWKKEWFDIEDAAYLNSRRRLPFFEVPIRLWASIARLTGSKPKEIALTTGARPGTAAVAHGLTWKLGDEIITATGEFPLQYATWKPMEEREGVKLKIVAPRDRFITTDDLIAAMTPKTRVISVSHVRFDDGSLLDASRVAAACHAQGAMLLLDASQSCGTLPMDVIETARRCNGAQ